MTNRLKLIAAIICLCFPVGFVAQSPYRLAMFPYQLPAYNPALSGVFVNQQYVATYRNQWSGQQDHPKMFMAYGEVDVENRFFLSAGAMNFVSSKVGTRLMNDLDFHIGTQYDMGNDYEYLLGVTYGFHSLKIEENDPEIGDPGNPEAIKSGVGTLFNLNFGGAIKRKDFMIGFSATNLLRHNYGELNVGTKRFHYAMTSYKFLIEKNTSITPLLLVRMEEPKTRIEGNIMISLKDQLWFGGNYNSRGDYAFMAGFDVKTKYRIGYSFENAAVNAPYNKSHEFLLAVVWKK